MRVKQVNQFINRFNNKDKEFSEFFDELKGRLPDRRDAVELLISSKIKPKLASDFLGVISDSTSSLIAFEDEDWFAHVTCLVDYQGKEDTLRLSLKIMPDKDNSFKWVISGASGDFLKLDTSSIIRFINPMSHETNFIDLLAVMRDKGNGLAYIEPSFEGDDLTLLVQAINRGNLAFAGVIDLEFFFLQINNWIIGIEDHNNLGAAGGWLISFLKQASDTDKSLFKQRHLYINY